MEPNPIDKSTTNLRFNNWKKSYMLKVSKQFKIGNTIRICLQRLEQFLLCACGRMCLFMERNSTSDFQNTNQFSNEVTAVQTSILMTEWNLLIICSGGHKW